MCFHLPLTLLGPVPTLQPSRLRKASHPIRPRRPSHLKLGLLNPLSNPKFLLLSRRKLLHQRPRAFPGLCKLFQLPWGDNLTAPVYAQNHRFHRANHKKKMILSGKKNIQTFISRLSLYFKYSLYFSAAKNYFLKIILQFHCALSTASFAL